MSPLCFTIYIKVPIKFEFDGEYYVSLCDFFDVCSQGKTKEEAAANFAEALHLYIDGCYDEGMLGEVFQKAKDSMMKIQVAQESNPTFVDVSIPPPMVSYAKNYAY